MVRPEGLCQMKNCNDTIGNRTRDLPACSTVPQPAAPPIAPTDFAVTFYKCMGHVFLNYCFLLRGACSDRVIISRCSLVQVKVCSL